MSEPMREYGRSQRYPSSSEPSRSPFESVRPTSSGEGSMRINVGRLWMGGFAAGVVAALLVVVGVLFIRGVLGINVLAPEGAGTYGNATTTTYAFGAFILTMLATALMHGMLLVLPSPFVFFAWIVVLVIAIGVLLPFTFSAPMDAKIATAALNGVVGICILSVVSSVASSATRD